MIDMLTGPIPIWFYLLNNVFFTLFLYYVWKDLGSEEKLWMKYIQKYSHKK